MQSDRYPAALPSALPISTPPRLVGARPDQSLTMAEVQCFLAGKNERARLALLAVGDPLGLAQRSKRWLVRACLLFDVQPFVERACVALSWDHASIDKSAGSKTVPLEYWLDRVFRRTADRLHATDQELDEARTAVSEPLSPRFLFLHAVLGIERDDLRSACITANALADREREAFHHLLVQGRTLDDYARLWGVDKEEARRAFQSALKTIGRAQVWTEQGGRASREQV